MSTSTDQTAQTAPSLSGFDPTSAITGLEQALLGFLGTPVHQVLGELPLQHFGGSPQLPSANVTVPPNQIDRLGLITPVINSLGTLGTGQYDPRQALSGISTAFDGTAMPVRQASGAAADGWQGESGTAANAKTQAALSNGADVANQANGLGNSLSTATAAVAQARQQLIDIIDEYQAKMATIDLSTPSGRSAAVAAANQATTESTAVMQELQGNLGSQAQQVSAIGTPVAVTQAPASGGSMIGGPIGSMLASADPTGVASTVLSDPRLTPKSFAQNLMDLIFLPQTMTRLSGEMAQTNSTMAQTNSIMSGLGTTLNTTNSTIGRTNSIMTGLGNTLGTTNSSMASLGGEMINVGNKMDNVGNKMDNVGNKMDNVGNTMDNMGNKMDNVGNKMDNVGNKMDNVGNTMGTLDGDMKNMDGDTNQLDNNLTTLNNNIPFGQKIPTGGAPIDVPANPKVPFPEN